MSLTGRGCPPAISLRAFTPWQRFDTVPGQQQQGGSVRIELFRMERTQCLYEHEVEYNLSESGVLPVRIEELLDDPAERERFLSLPLKYAESDGSPLLRERIAAWYPGATADSVLVT